MLAVPMRNQWVDLRRRSVSAVGTGRSYQDAPASGRRPPRAARTAPATSSATPTPTVIQYRGISKECVSATASPTSVTITPASIRLDPEPRHAMSEPPGGGERHAIVPVELAVQRLAGALEDVGADRPSDRAAHQIVEARGQPEVAADGADDEERRRGPRGVEQPRRKPAARRGRP